MATSGLHARPTWTLGFRVKPIELLFRFLDLDRRYYGEIDLSGGGPASGF